MKDTLLYFFLSPLTSVGLVAALPEKWKLNLLFYFVLSITFSKRVKVNRSLKLRGQYQCLRNNWKELLIIQSTSSDIILIALGVIWLKV